MTAQTAVIQTLSRAVEVLSCALIEASADADMLDATKAELRKRTRDLTACDAARRRALSCVNELYGGRVLSDEAAAAINKALEVNE